MAHSHDGGYTWLPVGEGLPKDDSGEVSAQAIAIDPTDAHVVYLGTGWGSFNGNGVYKSTDGGETWSPANRGMLDYGITALAVNPADPQVVYAGGDGGELFKSTDGGQTWNDLTADLLPDQTGVREIVVDPAVTGVVYRLGEHEGGPG